MISYVTLYFKASLRYLRKVVGFGANNYPLVLIHVFFSFLGRIGNDWESFHKLSCTVHQIFNDTNKIGCKLSV